MLQDQTSPEFPESAVEDAGWLSTFFENISFAPAIDIPLVVVGLLVFLLHFWSWAKASNAEADVDLESLLPKACVRLTLFFLASLALCYFVDVGVWVFPVVLMAVLLFGAGMNAGPDAAIGLIAVIFREACFGMPNLIHRGVPDPVRGPDPKNKFIGLGGTAASPLRPSGYISIEGEELAAISDTGELIDIGSSIVVTEIRNGQLRVQIESLGDPTDVA